MKWESVPCCDDCWWSVDDDNYPMPNDRGVPRDEPGIRFPYRLKQERRELETCHFCGFTTYSGIWVRADIDATPAVTAQRREGSGKEE